MITPTAAPPLHADPPWRPLRALTFYRVIIAGLLVLLFFGLREGNPFNVQAPALFGITVLAYLVVSLASGFAARLHWPRFDLQAPLQIFADIGAFSLLMHASGGVTSVFAILLVIAVAAGSLIVPGRFAYFFAAVATLALLYETGLTTLAQHQAGADDLTRAGLLGVALFAAAALAHALASRIRESEALAARRGIDLANLEQLNRQIIRQLQSGIVVTDAYERVRLANDQARAILGIDVESAVGLGEVAPDLAQALWNWKEDRARQFEPVVSGTGHSVLPRFRTLNTSEGSGALILLDDSAELARQTQQAKLASLGRLTASIAHEIRNPLGAISHAAQLLGESEALDPSDRRLIEIIHNHTARVNTIIENVLQLSRRRSHTAQALRLDEWLQTFCDEFLLASGTSREQFELDNIRDLGTVSFDPDHLHQVMTNLCENALLHAGADAKVVLAVNHSDGGALQLDITDNGPGIPKETAAQIFEPFFTTAATGTGLGLYIARELCDINHAHLSHQPRAEGGTCFRIQFATEQTI